MKKTILEIYALAVCFVLVLCFAITLGIATYNVIKITRPAFTLSSYNYSQYQSNDQYCLPKEQCKNKSTAEITKSREESYDFALKNEQREGMQSLVSSIITLLICLFIFIPHWYIARNSRK